MPTAAAQEEFDALFADKSRSSRHPEDARDHSSDEPDDREDQAPQASYPERDSDDDDDSPPTRNMPSRYYLPQLRSEANTGPKGVIADAQAFEKAKKQRRFSFHRSAPPKPLIETNSTKWYGEEKSSDVEEDDEGFMARWRQSRLKELQTNKISRNASPSRRLYGNLVTVDPEGYLDAIEKVPAETVVVVFIYDNLSDVSVMVEDCVRDVARQHPTTRFVKLHYEDAEMNVAGVPAILAYKGGDKFAGLVPVIDELPNDQELSATVLASVLRRHRILS